MKQVNKIIVYYTDGTYEEIRGAQTPHIPDIVKTYEKLYNKCNVCGLNLEGVMGYSCQNPKCPTGLGPTMCSDSSNNSPLS